MRNHYKPPSRLSTLLQSAPVFWGGFLAVAAVFGVYVAFHL